MGQQFFGRILELQIGKAGEEGLRWRQLRVQFEVEKTAASMPNKGKIRIYNLSKEHRAFAEEQKNLVFLKAGYGDELREDSYKEIEDIFQGNIAKAISERSGADWITDLELGDGETAFQESKLDKSFSAGTAVKDMFGNLIQETGLMIGDLTGIKDEKLISPMVLSGPVRKHMDDLTARQDAEWSIQDGKIQVLPRGGVTREEYVLLSPSTGLIGVPKKKIEKGFTGIEFTSLLQGRIRPGGGIRLESDTMTGNFRCERVVHKGDNRANEYFSVVEALAI